MKFQVFERNAHNIRLPYMFWTKKKKRAFGVNPFKDIKTSFGEKSFKLIFDVGANIGQTTLEIKKTFPNAEIWAFEPVENTFIELKKVTKRERFIKYFKIGFGAKREERELNVFKQLGLSNLNSLKESNILIEEEKEKVSISIDTLDLFCQDHGINKIGFLKIDTEGYDLEVLRGAKYLLENECINVLKIEVSMNPDNKFHAQFEDVKSILEPLGYRLFGIYDQVHEWKPSLPMLRRANLVYISESMKNQYKSD